MRHVANKEINGKKCIIAWYVDDTKISNVDTKVITEAIEKFESKFGKIMVTQGKSHVFLGMDIQFQKNGTVNIKVKEYIKEAIADFGESRSKSVVATLAKIDLFEIDEASRELTGKGKDIFTAWSLSSSTFP